MAVVKIESYCEMFLIVKYEGRREYRAYFLVG